MDEETGKDYRIEHDSMGEVRVPADAKWRAQTQRAVENFPISGQRLERAHIAALARVKAAAAKVNAELEVLDPDIAEAIQEAAAEVAEGRWDAHFPIDVFQTGSGTSSNMNTNEVLATLATERLGRAVHPNDHVNASQSSNDVFPSSIHIAATGAVTEELIPALDHLAVALERKSAEFADVVKSGRTHLMDATPVTLGQEFGGYAAQIRYGVERLRASLPASPNCRWAARPSAPVSTPRPASPPPSSPRSPASPDCRSPRPGTTSRRRARGTASSRPPASSARSRSPSPRSPTICAGWRRVRAPGWPRSASPTSSRAPRSCRAR